MSVQPTRVLDPIFGSPILRAANNGTATWSKINTSSQWQKGTGWQASLYGGAQTGDDWGAMFFPVLEQRVTDFNAAQWSYYMTATQTMGVNVVIWVHDPNNLNKRAEITQLGNTALLGKTLGWNSHTLLKTTTQFAWYGEDWSGGSAAAITGSDLTSGTQYTWAQFQADPLFSTYHIYRVSLEYGWEASGTLDYVWVVEAKFNGLSVPFIPSVQELLAADTALAKVTLLANSGVDIGDVDILSITAGDNRIGRVSSTFKEVRVSKVIDASDGAYADGDVVNNFNCCAAAAAWEFDVARVAGGYVTIWNARLFNETENQAVQYDLLLFNAAPTGELRDNVASNNPTPADMAKYIDVIELRSSIARGAAVATTTSASPSTVGGLPITVKCATADTKIYVVLVTRTIYTQTATDDIEILWEVEQH